MSSAPRMTARQSEAQDRRNRMTNRRQELTSKIRKQKKSEYLARKRNLPSVIGTTSTTASIDDVKELVHAYCRSSTLGTLKALHDGLKHSASLFKAPSDNPLIFFSQENDTVIQSSAMPFLKLLLRQSSETTAETMVLEILVSLTAISSPPMAGYYGHVPITWSALVAQDAEWLARLVQLASSSSASDNVFVILGNLVGEESTAVQLALRQAGVIHVLVAAIRHPIAAWALTNAIRSDQTTLGSFYFSQNLLTPQLLGELLLEPKLTTQAAWMVASLTSREIDTVHYLMGHTNFVSTLIKCMEQPTSQDHLLALIQAIGNIASFESCVAPLLAFPTLPQLVGQLLQQQSNSGTNNNSNVREIVSQSAWLAGSLLYGAGLSDHPSTTVAAPILVPILFQQLHDDRSLEERREMASALSMALDLLPDAALSIVAIPIPAHSILRPALRTLVGLLESPDSDAVSAAVNVVDSLLRRDTIENLQVDLEEENIRDALEGVCDSTMDAAAEVAANLLDDYFYNLDEEELVLEPQVDAQTGGFAFGIPAGSNPNPGIGRGRGAVIPSWMSKSQ